MKPPTSLVRNDRGLSLVELLLSMGIATIVIFGSCIWMIDSIRNFHFYRTRSTLTDNSTVVSDFIMNDVQSSGGASAGAWAAISVSNNCNAFGPLPACAGSDRLTVFQMSSNQFQCEVATQAGNHVTISTTTGCCLSADMEKKPFIMVLNENFYYGYSTHIDTAACAMDYVDYQGEHADFTGGITSWVKGSVTFMNAKTIYLDPNAHQLRQFADANNNNTIDAKEDTIIAEDVYDFQVALGYDFKPTDRVVQDLGNDQDEWLYNVPGEAWGQGVFATAKQNQLRMIGIGVMLGTPVRGSPNAPENHQEPVHIFDGPDHLEPGWYLQVMTSKILLRNISSY